MRYHMEFSGVDPDSQKPRLIDTDEKFSQTVSVYIERHSSTAITSPDSHQICSLQIAPVQSAVYMNISVVICVKKVFLSCN